MRKYYLMLDNLGFLEPCKSSPVVITDNPNTDSFRLMLASFKCESYTKACDLLDWLPERVSSLASGVFDSEYYSLLLTLPALNGKVLTPELSRDLQFLYKGGEYQ